QLCLTVYEPRQATRAGFVTTPVPEPLRDPRGPAAVWRHTGPEPLPVTGSVGSEEVLLRGFPAVAEIKDRRQRLAAVRPRLRESPVGRLDRELHVGGVTGDELGPVRAAEVCAMPQVLAHHPPHRRLAVLAAEGPAESAHDLVVVAAEFVEADLLDGG